MSSDMLNDILGQDRSQNNNTIFHLIAMSGCNNIMDCIWNGTQGNALAHILRLKNDNGETCLHTVAKCLQGDEAEMMIAQMFDMGADLNAQEDGTGNTVLHTAVECQNYQLVEWLLAMSAETNVENKSGLTPYQVAEEKDDQEMMDLFELR